MIVIIITTKILKMILSIFAFATTCSVETETSFSIKCDGSFSRNYSFKLDYPFIINMRADVPLCSDPKTSESIYYSVKSSCEFYVFIGVMAFLYCLAALVIYIYFDEVYRKNTRLTIIIFGFLNTFVWAGNLWFLYKETPWFKVQAAPPIDPGMPQETDPQRV
ncbi:synaptophysin-like isoform X1 [Octopus vulgaris]|uniref:Synaptophysin-like isoform X1 n=1 Tax=Octopus vulgaris TaxID=6645 RepID=A0AA36F2N0_OCTVU|nr:synaptophysin-like isoform X1 [Octopus vulgaris]